MNDDEAINGGEYLSDGGDKSIESIESISEDDNVAEDLLDTSVDNTIADHDMPSKQSLIGDELSPEFINEELASDGDMSDSDPEITQENLEDEAIMTEVLGGATQVWLNEDIQKPTDTIDILSEELPGEEDEIEYLQEDAHNNLESELEDDVHEIQEIQGMLEEDVEEEFEESEWHSEEELTNAEESGVAFVDPQQPDSVDELDSEEEIDNLEEGTDQENEEDPGAIIHIEEGAAESETTLNETSKSDKSPIFVEIRGDGYLLLPFYEPCEYELTDMISLFSAGEVAGCTLEHFFQLLRGNGDLIDAYNFNMEDELTLDIPELSLCITEDNIYARAIKLDDLIELFYSLKHNSEGSRTAPDKLTIRVDMQQRFITKYNTIATYAGEHKTFDDLYKSASTNGEKEEHVTKKRRLSK